MHLFELNIKKHKINNKTRVHSYMRLLMQLLRFMNGTLM